MYIFPFYLNLEISFPVTIFYIMVSDLCLFTMKKANTALIKNTRTQYHRFLLCHFTLKRKYTSRYSTAHVSNPQQVLQRPQRRVAALARRAIEPELQSVLLEKKDDESGEGDSRYE